MKDCFKSLKEVLDKKVLRIVLFAIGILVFMAVMMDTIVVHAAEDGTETYYFEISGTYYSNYPLGYSCNARFETTDTDIVGYVVAGDVTGRYSIALTSLNNTDGILYGKAISCVSSEIVENGYSPGSSELGVYNVGGSYSSFYMFTEEYEYKNITSYNTNIMIFDSADSLKNYIANGDDSGQINKSVETSLDDFSLTGFQVDDSIYATWTGISSSMEFDLSEVYVNISPQYFITLEAGEEQQDFESPGVIQVPLTDFSFFKAYSDYFVNNPYAGRAQLILYFYPTYDDKENLYLYRGKSIKVVFDTDGNVTNLDIPESSITPVYNKEFSFLNFTSTSEFHNWGDSFIHCYWTGTSVDNVVDYTYSDIKVEIYAEYGEQLPETYSYAHKWIDYPLNEIVYFSQRKLSLNLTELHEYALTQDCRFYNSNDGWKNKKIRLTPYYKTGTEYVYGKPVEVTLTTLAGVGSILQKDEETGTYEDLEKDYLTDNGVFDDLLDDVVNGTEETPDLEGITINLFSLLMGMFAACGQLPALVAMVFGFLPSYFTTMMVVALSLVIVLRLIGR